MQVLVPGHQLMVLLNLGISSFLGLRRTMQDRLELGFNVRLSAGWPWLTCTDIPRAPVKGTRTREKFVAVRDNIGLEGEKRACVDGGDE